MALKRTVNLLPPAMKDELRLGRDRARHKSWRAALAHELYWSRHKNTLREQAPLLDPSPYYWLFILGVNNSGTTLLENLIKRHPLVKSFSEEGQHLTDALHGALTRGELDRLWTRRLDLYRLTEMQGADAAVKAQYDWAFFLPDKPGVVLEKSPPNTLRSRWLQRYFRPSRFVALVRHPFAVVEGIRRRTNCTAEAAAKHWTTANECLLEDEGKLERRLLFHYEAFCEQPRAHLERLERFLGLGTPFDRSILEGQFNVHNADNKPQTLQNMNAKSVARLSETDKSTILQVAEKVMARLGYDETNYADSSSYPAVFGSAP